MITMALAWCAGAALAVLLGITILEAVARRLVLRRHGPRARNPQALRDRFAAWRNNPSFARAGVTHNAQGFRRSTDVSLSKAPGCARVFILGGSAVYGSPGAYPHIDNRFSLIRDDELIDAYLERRLNERLPSRRWEAINAACCGYRLHQQLALLQSNILKYRPDYVVLIDGYNDFIELYNSARSGPGASFDPYENTPGRREFDALANPGSFRSAGAFAAAWLRANSALLRVAQGRMPGRVGNPWSAAGSGDRQFGDPARLSDLSTEERLAFSAALAHTGYYARIARQIRGIVAIDGIRTIFALQPILALSRKPRTDAENRMVEYEKRSAGPLYCCLFDAVYGEFARDLAGAARTDGFEFLNLRDAFDGEPLQTFTDFAHLTPRGNEIIADRIAASIAADAPPPGAGARTASNGR